MDEIVEFLRMFSDLEYRVRVAREIEPDHRAYQEQVWALDEMYGGGLGSGLNRPNEPAEVYASAANIEQAAREQPRSIFAVARYQIDGEDVYRAWMGDTELRDFGNSLRQNLYLRRTDGDFEIIAINRACSNCKGTGIEIGQTCEICGGAGWLAHRGTDWAELGEVLELRKLERPSDARYHACYDAIPVP